MLSFPSHSGTNSLALLKLLQLVSPVLPIGSYAYSQGLESAIAEKWVVDSSTTRDWVSGLLENSLTQLEVPILYRQKMAWEENDLQAVIAWNQFLLASRETREIYEEDLQLGRALARLLGGLGLEEAREWKGPVSYLAMYSLAAARWAIPSDQAAMGFLWTWAENQVVCAVKYVPLGQTAGQLILQELGTRIPDLAIKGMNVEDDQIGYMAPGQVLASMLHETQYSRLFRS